MMLRFCTVCREQISDEKRLRRSSPFCSDECRRQAKNTKRNLSALKKCRLCGRRFRKKVDRFILASADESMGRAAGAQPSTGS